MDKQQYRNKIKQIFDDLEKDIKKTFTKRTITIVATICFPIINFIALGLATLVSVKELILRPKKVYQDIYNKLWYTKSLEKCERSLIGILTETGKPLSLTIPMKAGEKIKSEEKVDFIGKKRSKYLH